MKYPKVGVTILRGQIAYIKKRKPKNYNEERVMGLLDKCCDFYSECHCREECRILWNTWSGLLPLGKEKVALAGAGKTAPGDWMRGTLHSTTLRPMRERIY